MLRNKKEVGLFLAGFVAHSLKILHTSVFHGHVTWAKRALYVCKLAHKPTSDNFLQGGRVLSPNFKIAWNKRSSKSLDFTGNHFWIKIKILFARSKKNDGQTAANK